MLHYSSWWFKACPSTEIDVFPTRGADILQGRTEEPDQNTPLPGSRLEKLKPEHVSSDGEDSQLVS